MTTDVAALLSAYLDGELTADERRQVERALEANPGLRGELTELGQTRGLIRGLADVEPRRPLVATAPPRPPQHGRHRLALAVVGVAAVWLVVLSVGVSLGSLPIAPDVDQLALQHASAGTTMDFEPMAFDEMADDPAVLDDVGHGMERAAIYQADDVTQVRYSDGQHDLSVFHQRGEVDWDEMPDAGEMAMMDDGPVWMSTMAGLDVLVTQRGDLVVTIVADGDMDQEMTMEASVMVPEVEMSEGLVDRLVDAPRNVFDRF